MKWCIIVNGAPFLTEFLGKVSSVLLEQGDECVLVFSSKLAEFREAQYYPKRARFVSEIDWCQKYYDASRKDYGNLTWRELFPDFDRAGSWPWGYKKSARYLAQQYQFFKEFFQQERPDAVLFEPPSGGAAQPASFVCAEYGIPYLGIIDSRITGHLDVLDAHFDNWMYQEVFRALSVTGIPPKEREFVEHFIQGFLSHEKLPSYLGVGKIRFGIFTYVLHYLERVKEIGGPLLRYFKGRRRFKDVDFESELRVRVALRAPWNLAFRQMRIARQKQLYQSLNPQDDYYVFPLHLQPEATTLVQAMPYVNQASVIQSIAFSLPFPCKLYVKEHPYAVGTKPDTFYEEIRRIPNVKLIAPNENMQELIENSQGVITLTGTVGLEAALAGKPAYILGDVFYDYHPLCRKLKNVDELQGYILRDREAGVSQGDLREQNVRFLISYIRNIIPGTTTLARAEKDTNDYQLIAAELRRVAQRRHE
ncbi:MAG: hypothetical protein Q8P39_03415 [Candidatus Yanofskybacteria bacterium]|nr:hypothetical protein [Candidatus Yanofskybacteria bacterium]